jgi:HAE1 family hydrophobic/amphiphilic exporter-1
MNLSALFIRRPIATTLIMVGIVLFGAFAYPQLPVNDLPNVDYPVINVRASLPGASPQTMAASVATPLEKQFSTIAGLETMTSSSSLGSTNVTLQFTLSRNIDAAAQDVQAAISQTLRQLPQGILPPSYNKSNPADSPILFLALTSDLLPLSTLDEYAQTTLAQRISTVDGVAQVQVFGSQKYAVRIQLDPQALAARGVGIDQVSDAIASGNVNLPTGVLWGPEKALTLRSNSQLESAKEFRDLIVKSEDGAAVRLGDLGTVVDGVQDTRTASWFNGRRAIVLAVQRQPGTNTVRVADAVHAMVDRLRPQLPGSVRIETLNDRSVSIRRSVRDVQITLAVTLCLVVSVIFLFLRNASATLVPSLALPLSITGTFALMKPFGFSLDNLSLMALTLSVGFVVDDAIVMLENCVRHLEMGKPRMQAALDGSREIGFTILSMTLSLVAVFIPVLFMGGLLGRLFHEFAVVISIAILVSGFVSLTLTPMMASRFLRPDDHSTRSPILRASEAAFTGSLRFYESSLAWVMDHRRTALAFSALILVGTVGLFMLIPKGFIPSEDIDQLTGTTEAAEGTSFESMVRHQQQIAAILQKDPNVAGFMSSVGASGGGGGGGSNQGRLFVRLRPRGERRLSADALGRQLTPRLNAVPGMRVYLQNPPPVRIGSRSAKSQYQYTLTGTDLLSLYENSARLESKLRSLPALENVTSDLQIKNPEIRVDLDRDRASTLGVTPRQVDEALYDAYGSRQVSTIFTPTNQYWVVLELLPPYQRDVGALQLLNVRSSRGDLVPIGTVARLTPGLGPLAVSHSGQLPAVTLSFDVKPGTGLSEAVAQVQAASRTTLSSDISTAFAGTAQAFQASQQGLTLLLVIAVLVIYLVLGVLYESFVHPITILSGLPFAGFGALLTLLLFRTELSVYAFVGVIMLIGLVKKNAIMMIDFAIAAERNEGRSARDAILEAALVRFRPIMMTTMAALMGTLPIAVGWGAGAESRRPLGLAVVGGLAFSQIVTLYVTPVFYTYLAGLQRRLSWSRRRAGAAEYAAGGAGAQPAISNVPASMAEALPKSADLTSR